MQRHLIHWESILGTRSVGMGIVGIGIVGMGTAEKGIARGQNGNDGVGTGRM